MFQKLFVGLLGLTVFGAAGVGIYDSTQPDTHHADAAILADAAEANLVSAPVEAPQTAPQAAPTVTPAAPLAQDSTGPVQLQQQTLQQQALTMVGDPWTAQGTIAAFDTAGMTLTLSDGTQIYVELGPSHYWQTQAVTLAIGDAVTVTGFYNGEQYHAATVTKADGSQLAVRTIDGLPLWSGGASGGQNQQGAANGNAAGQTAQVAAEDWITLEGTVAAINGSTLTVQTQAGETLVMQLGQANFMQSQGVSFAPGDAISVTGFWQGATFRAGDITKLATGERLMLLDPNGRPLWGGPGRAGAQGQAGQGQAQAGQTQGQVGQQGQGATTAQGQSQGTTWGQGGGNGRGYRGGRQ